MANTLMRLMGISATGKGTRTLALIRYLVEDLHREPMTFKIKVRSENMSCFGLYFKEENIFIFGKFTKNNYGMYAWAGLDSFGGSKSIVDWYLKFLPEVDYNIFCEGNIGWHKLHEMALYPFDGMQRIRIYHFGYTSKEEYLGRVMERNGKGVKGEDFWKTSLAIQKHLEEIQNKIDTTRLVVSNFSHDETVWEAAHHFLWELDPNMARGLMVKYLGNEDLLLRRFGENDTPSQEFLKTMYDRVKEGGYTYSSEVASLEDLTEAIKADVINFQSI